MPHFSPLEAFPPKFPEDPNAVVMLGLAAASLALRILTMRTSEQPTQNTPSRLRYPQAKHRIVALSTLLVSLLWPAHSFGQTLPIPNGATEAEIKAAAQKEAATFPTMNARPDSAQPRVCVNAYDVGPARSGEFTIGGNLSGASAMRAGREGKVWWAPLYAGRNMPPLLVRGRSLTNLRDTVLFASSMVASPVFPGAPLIPEAERKYFFPSGITIPQPGRWLLIATSGQNWGCFILTVL